MKMEDFIKTFYIHSTDPIKGRTLKEFVDDVERNTKGKVLKAEYNLKDGTVDYIVQIGEEPRMIFTSPFLYTEPLIPHHKTDNQHESTGA